MCFGLQKRENSSQEYFPVNVLLGERHECASSSILPGNKDHILSQLARVCFFHRERVLQRGLASAPEGEMQVNIGPLVSNLLISLEGKKKP